MELANEICTITESLRKEREALYSRIVELEEKLKSATIDYIAMWEAADEEYYSKGYSEGEYCHKQSFIWGFQEGVDWLSKNYTVILKK